MENGSEGARSVVAKLFDNKELSNVGPASTAGLRQPLPWIPNDDSQGRSGRLILTLLVMAPTLGARLACAGGDGRQVARRILSREYRVVTKKEIVRTISEEIGLTQLKTKEIVQKTFDAIVNTLVEDGRIELRNFGVFEVKRRAPRKARNPRTGAKVFVPEKFVVTFKPGKEMEQRVREMERQAAAAAQAARQHAGAEPQSAGITETLGSAAGYNTNPSGP